MIEEILNIEAPPEFTGNIRPIVVIFYGRTTAGPFEYHSYINPYGTLSAALKVYVEQLD
ncbi:hypothetical protein MHOCP_09770 [Moorella humiferrea]